MQSALIIALQFCSALAMAGAVVRIAVSRLALRYPLFTLMVGFAALRSLVLLAVGGWEGKLHPYLEIWRATLGITFALEAAACLEAFWILALHFRKIKLFGTIVFLFLATLGVTLSYSLVAIWSRWWASPFIQASIVMQRTALTLIVIALCSLLFFRQFSSVPIKPNAIRHLWILVFLFGSMFLSGFLVQSGSRTRGFLANLAITLGSICAYGAWTLLIRPSGERLPFEPAPLISDEEFAAGEAQDRAALEATLRHGRASLQNLKQGIRN